jgi:hypothetical protein
MTKAENVSEQPKFVEIDNREDVKYYKFKCD